MTDSLPPTHPVPDRDADPTRGLTPPTRRTAETDAMKELTARRRGRTPLFSGPLVRAAIGQSFVKLDPRHLVGNPVMFVVGIGAVLTTYVTITQLLSGDGAAGFSLQISLWLWFTVLFANFAEAMAEARGRAQATTPARHPARDAGRRVKGDAAETSARASSARAMSSSSRRAS